MEKFRGQIQISFRYSEHLGPRFDVAGVTLRLEYADDYKFLSTAHWDYDDYTDTVERGVIDGLIESGVDPDLGIHITLQEVDFDYVNSSMRTFYTAAKCAVKSKAIINEVRKSNSPIK